MSESLEGVNAVEVVEATQESEPTTDVKQEVEESVESEEVAEVKEPTEADKVREAMQKRIDRQTAANRREQEARRQAEERLQKLEEQMQAQKPTDDSPKEEDFETFEDYVDHEVKQRLEAERNKSLQEQHAKAEQEKLDSLMKQHKSNVEAFKVDYPDYEEKSTVAGEVMGDILQQKGTNDPTVIWMKELFLSSPKSADLEYMFGSDPELLESIANKSPVDAIRELVALESTVTRKPKTENSKPAPTKPMNTGGRGKKDLSKMTGKEILKSLGI